MVFELWREDIEAKLKISGDEHESTLFFSYLSPTDQSSKKLNLSYFFGKYRTFEDIFKLIN